MTSTRTDRWVRLDGTTNTRDLGGNYGARNNLYPEFALVAWAALVGEPLEIFPFLGSSRLEEPLSRYPVEAVFHGHAHRGRPEGKTAQGIPVYNVAAPLLRRSRPDEPPLSATVTVDATAGIRVQ